jgi:hypothetical protein
VFKSDPDYLSASYVADAPGNPEQSIPHRRAGVRTGVVPRRQLRSVPVQQPDGGGQRGGGEGDEDAGLDGLEDPEPVRRLVADQVP